MREKLFEAVRPEELGALAEFAARLWHSAYDGLLGGGQVGYMTDKFQSAEAMRRQIESDNYIYFYIVDGGRRIGYCAIRPESEKLFLSKLYLEESARGKGWGRKALAEVAETARRLSLKSVYLTVNKQNDRAVRAYERFGFRRAGACVTDIGGGYAMDDYIYEYAL